MKPGILVWLEVKDGAFRRASLEALACARSLAAACGGDVVAAVTGSGVSALAPTAPTAPSSSTKVFSHDRPSKVTVAPWPCSRRTSVRAR